MVVYGSGADEKCLGLQEIKVLVERDFAQSESASAKDKWSSISAAGSVAWIAADIEMTVSVEGQELGLPARFTGVLEKRGDRWYWVQFHISLAAAGQAEGQSFPKP